MAEGRSDPRPGDLIEIFRPGYRHWALYVGNGYVIHVTSVGARDVLKSVDFASMLSGTATVKKERLDDVQGKCNWRVNNTYDRDHTPRPVEKIIQDAEWFVGKAFRYDLMNNNCEHFVTLLRYDEQFSRQAQAAFLGVGTALAISAIIATALKRLSDKKKLRSIPVVQAEVWNEEREIPCLDTVEDHEPAQVPSYASLGHPF